jgi:O-antigen ligase
MKRRQQIMMNWKRAILFLAASIMIIGMLLPRGIMSTAMIVFIAAGFLHGDARKHLQLFFATPLLWGMSLLLLIPLISGAWSENHDRWLDTIRIKLPLLFLPLAFASPLMLGRKELSYLAYLFVAVTCLGSLLSISNYLTDYSDIHAAYLKAKMMKTPMANDHIRFSWMITLAILFSTWLVRVAENRGARIFLISIVVWLLAYQHILAARTGLFTLYISVLIAAVWWIVKKKNRGLAILGISIIVLLPLAAYFTLPTSQNRVRYLKYDASFYTRSAYLPGSNDGGRYFSIRAGLDLFSSHQTIGVGFGDIADSANAWYARHVPQMPATSRLLPHSEWLVYGTGAGWPGLIVFTFVMLVPFFMRSHRAVLSWWLVNSCALLVFLFDVGLEVQFGVFCYAFPVLWTWKWIRENDKPA